jgi:hypothetical protein
MTSFRSRFIGAIFFCLISLGQAYPYSYAWAMGQKMQCGCNLAGHKCIHGCDLKHHGHHHSHSEIESNDHRDSKPGWVNPTCARQKQRDVLSFQMDPFIPQSVKFKLRPQTIEFGLSFPTQYPVVTTSPLERPPKLS